MKVLVVDDNIDFSSTIADIVKSFDLETEIINVPKKAISYMEKEYNNVSLILLDVEFGFGEKLNGLDLLDIFRRNYPYIPVVMITGKGTIETAVRATKLGAINFIEKNVITKARLRNIVDTLLKGNNGYGSDVEILSFLEQNGIIGRSKSMVKLGENILRYASAKLNILITGKTGTGKRLIAECLHKNSNRKHNKFVIVNIPALLSNNNYREELFGTENNLNAEQGLFQQANNGTLFFDGIDELSPELQAQLLVPIEENKIRPVGAVDATKVDIKFISSTNKDLETLLQSNSFNERLYHKLRECEIHLPSLSEHKEDIPCFINYYTNQYNEDNDKNKSFSQSSIDFIMEQKWYGNIKELSSFIKLCLQTTNNNTLEITEIISMLNKHNATLQYKGIVNLSISEDKTLKEDLAEVDKIKIENILAKTTGNVSKAAAILGISRETLHNKIRRYDINTKDFRNKN